MAKYKYLVKQFAVNSYLVPTGKRPPSIKYASMKIIFHQKTIRSICRHLDTTKRFVPSNILLKICGTGIDSLLTCFLSWINEKFDNLGNLSIGTSRGLFLIFPRVVGSRVVVLVNVLFQQTVEPDLLKMLNTLFSVYHD